MHAAAVSAVARLAAGSAVQACDWEGCFRTFHAHEEDYYYSRRCDAHWWAFFYWEGYVRRTGVAEAFGEPIEGIPEDRQICAPSSCTAEAVGRVVAARQAQFA